MEDGLSLADDKSTIEVSNLALMHRSTMTKINYSLGDREKETEVQPQVLAMEAHKDHFALWFQGGLIKVWCQDQAGGVELDWEWKVSDLVRNKSNSTFSFIKSISWPGV